jgi:hypothetical protein
LQLSFQCLNSFAPELITISLRESKHNSGFCNESERQTKRGNGVLLIEKIRRIELIEAKHLLNLLVKDYNRAVQVNVKL